MDTNTAGREEWRAARRALVEELTRLRDGFCHAGWMDRETSRLGPMGFAGGRPILQTAPA
jgi:hypothetical protein